MPNKMTVKELIKGLSSLGSKVQNYPIKVELQDVDSMLNYTSEGIQVFEYPNNPEDNFVLLNLMDDSEEEDTDWGDLEVNFDE